MNRLIGNVDDSLEERAPVEASVNVELHHADSLLALDIRPHVILVHEAVARGQRAVDVLASVRLSSRGINDEKVIRLASQDEATLAGRDARAENEPCLAAKLKVVAS